MNYRHPPRLTRRLRHRPSTALAVLCGSGLCLVLSACSNTNSSTPSAPVDHVAITTTTLLPSGPTAPSLSAYRGMWADMVTASRTADYQSPLLSAYASDRALSVLVQGLAANQFHGIVVKGHLVLHPQVTSLEPTTDPTQATISDCLDDTHWLEYKVGGGLVDNIPGGHHATAAIVTNLGGIWKVTQLAVQQAGTC